MTAAKLGQSAQDCLDKFKELQAALPTGQALTRDRYRKESGIPEAVWEYHFGTFAELKRQVGAAPVATTNKLTNAVAKATAAKRFEPLNKERAAYADAYTRTDSGRYKTILVASDLHDKEIDPFYLRVFLDTAKRVQPEIVSLGGDVFDLPEFGKYTVDPREWDAVGRIKFTHANIFQPLRDAVPDAQIDLIEGNHECVTLDTEVLTIEGWMPAYYVHAKSLVASFDVATHQVRYKQPVAVAIQDDRVVYEIETTYKMEQITGNHRIMYDGKLTALDDITDLDGARMQNALLTTPPRPIMLDPDIVRFAMWVVTKGSIYRTEGPHKYWVRFNGLPQRQVRHIKGIVSGIQGLTWEMAGNGLEVEGPAIAAILEIITGLDKDIPEGRWTALPDWLDSLPIEYGKIVAQELTWASTQGFMSRYTSYYNGWDHKIGEGLQWMLCTRGIPCSMRYLEHGQYILVFNEFGGVEKRRGKRVRKNKLLGPRTVKSIQTVDGTLITRREGKINFTGNCRLVKHLADFSPATRAILGDLHGMTVGDLFGLGKYQINYVAKADLKSYTERDHRKELENNYRIYYDAVMVHHFPHARNMGLPGVNGHHHSHIVWPMFNVHAGAYEWHQLGAGHRRSASYCEGERWHNGFALMHVDTLTKTVNIEYIPITNMAVVGGKFYTREPHEIVTV